MKRTSTKDLLEKLAQNESAFLNVEFLAPRFPGQQVNVKIGHTICQMKIRGNFVGWGVFKPRDFRVAKFVREATMMERERYLSALPAVKMIVAGRDDYGYLAIQASGHSFVPVRLWFAEELELFDYVSARFDGLHFMHEDRASRDPAFADALRTSASRNVSNLIMPGLMPAEAWVLGEVVKANQLAEAEARRNSTEYRIADAIAHAGAVMRSYVERADGYTVEYEVGGETHKSHVDKNLRVRSAGICLSDKDDDYDLASLVSVINEGQERALIVRMGENRRERQ